MTRPFRFSLEKVLDYRQQLEDEAMMALSRAQQVYQRQVDAVEALGAGLEAHEASLYEKTLNADEMWLWKQYKERLVQEMAEAENRMLTLARRLNEARRVAVERSKERKLLDKLKFNQRLRHEETERKKEQDAFDEMATVRYRPPAF